MSFSIKFDSELDSLFNLCLECISKSLFNVFCLVENGYEIPEDAVLPREICESLIEMYQRTGRSVDDKFINLFDDKTKSTLQKVAIRNSLITDEGLRKVLQFYLRELHLSNCKNLTPVSFDLIDLYGKNLRSLSLVSGINVVPHLYLSSDSGKYKFYKRGYIFNTPNLSRLVLKIVDQEPKFFSTLLSSLPKLTYLDLSGCSELGDLSFLSHCPNLLSLTLFDCLRVQYGINNICKLSKLRHLDISQCTDGQGIFENENQVLKNLVASLPNLSSLDISGTNLAGKGNVEKELFDESQEYHPDIPGLVDRTKNHLEFLGLYGTLHRACKRHDIPAVKISGDANEEQILTAATVYMNRSSVLQRVLNDLFHCVRSDAYVNVEKILQITLEALYTHIQEKYIQISASAALFYIVRSKGSVLTLNVRRLIINTLLNSMDLYINDDTLTRNGCLTLCQFRVPQDFLFVYNKLVDLLLRIIMANREENFVLRLTIYMMNSLACQVNDVQKEILGNLGIIEKMLMLINSKIEEEDIISDDVLEVAWSTMWNVTDETPVNCERFLRNDGMKCFTLCLQKFRNKNELMRNMMGLLGNVAEVKELRAGLMSHITIFYDLVDSFQDGIEVSYNAAGVISHIASDGPEAWSNSCPYTREKVLEKMVSSIESWELNSERNINYRSFEPILKLTRIRHTPPCQLWAIWALANLTKVYPDKYCPILEAENGLVDVQALIDENNVDYPRIRDLAQIVMNNYAQYKQIEVQNLNHPEKMLIGDIVE